MRAFARTRSTRRIHCSMLKYVSPLTKDRLVDGKRYPMQSSPRIPLRNTISLRRFLSDNYSRPWDIRECSWTRVPDLFLARCRENLMRRRNERHGTQDPMPSCEGVFTLNTWKSNMFAENDDRRRDMRRLFPDEWRCMEFSQCVGKHNGDGTCDINAP